MSRIICREVVVEKPNPGSFTDPITLKITLEIFGQALSEPIEVKFTWSPIWDFPVDQELDELEVGPLATLGRHEFTVQSDPPDISGIPDPTGPTALIVSLWYKGSEFLHLGFNVAVTYEGEEIPEVFTADHVLQRHIGRCFIKHREVERDVESTIAATPFDSDMSESDEKMEGAAKRTKVEKQESSESVIKS